MQDPLAPVEWVRWSLIRCAHTGLKTCATLSVRAVPLCWNTYTTHWVPQFLETVRAQRVRAPRRFSHLEMQDPLAPVGWVRWSLIRCAHTGLKTCATLSLRAVPLRWNTYTTRWVPQFLETVRAQRVRATRYRLYHSFDGFKTFSAHSHELANPLPPCWEPGVSLMKA